jgi:vacuolar-type H+-ATPase subunit B/Vma2
MGEEGMTETQHKYLAFLKDFLETFINQSPYKDRNIVESLNLAWGLLKRFEENQLPKIDKSRFFDEYHVFFRYKPLTLISDKVKIGRTIMFRGKRIRKRRNRRD